MTGKHVILFAGTTEGRVLANWLDDQPGITGTVCVATEYGAELLTEEMPLKHLKVHCGRLDEDEIEAFLKKNGTHLVIDATHPYAQVVTANIRKACEKFPHICLLRCLRKESANMTENDRSGKNNIVHVKDTEGNLESIASTDYVNYAHQAGLEVWAAIRDFDGGIGSNDESLQLLSYSSRRENLINQLIGAVMQVGIDGINVDFEKISKDCGVHYIQFIRELSVKCRQNGIVLSVDNYVPKGYNQQYNRKEQGVMADYVIIMGYDEHNGSSLEAGSVSSYEFVKEGIEETIKEVPAEKVINGIPFFTRLWSETPKTQEELNQEAGTEAADYPMKVTSEALGMSTARDKISQAGAETTLDETTGNNYATWEADGVTYEIWLEDATSIEPKLQLMKENKLAGTAAWALGQESSDIWDLILKYVN